MGTQALNDILFLDTSLGFFSAGYIKNGKIRTCRERAGSISRELEGMLADFLARDSLKPGSFGNYAYNPGPGSFTGLRAGASYLSGLCSALGSDLWYIPLKSVADAEFLKGPGDAFLRSSKRREFYYTDNSMEGFRTVSEEDVPALGKKRLFYEGTYDFSGIPGLIPVTLYPEMFLKNSGSMKKIEKNGLMFYYINDPDTGK